MKYVEKKSAIKAVIYNDLKQCYVVTFTNGNVSLCNTNGEQEVYCCKQALTSIAYAKKYKTYVSICEDNVIRVS